MEEANGVPIYGWRNKLSHQCPTKCAPFKFPRLKQLPPVMGLTFRYTAYWYRLWKEGRKPIMDHRNMIDHNPIYGVPLGGIGSGSIGRGYRGEFCRYNMVPGMYKHKVVHANQFIVTIRQSGQTVYQKVMCPVRPKHKLSDWDWSYNAEHATYHGLYPQSWTVYEIPEHQVTLTCRQISPVMPHNYEDTCLPCGVFEWTIDNRSPNQLDISITLTWKNGQGVKEDSDPGCITETFRDTSGVNAATGVVIRQQFNDMKCTYAVGAAESASRKSSDSENLVRDDGDRRRITTLLSWNPLGTGGDLWTLLRDTGCLETKTGFTTKTNTGEEVAVAVCSQHSLESGTKTQAQFTVVWDMPDVRFRAGEVQYRKRYTRWFGHDHEAGPKIAGYALNHHREWAKEINRWQEPILNNPKLPSWYKSALFNELYYLSDGGTIWLDPVDSNKAYKNWALPKVPKVMEEYGRFAYLEGQEYRMYNTYDVHHYGSFALVMLWPKLQESLQYDIASATMAEDSRPIKYLMSGTIGVVKTKHAVPHDLGDPEDEPWIRFNCYNIHPTYEWKDLNPKFVLQVYRDYSWTHDLEYINTLYPVTKAVMEYSMKWDTDDDGLIENGGFADQTYDAWTATGVSAYCGGLWLAALRCMVEMARLLKLEDDAQLYDKILQKGRISFERTLWNGEYYDYDSSSSPSHDSVMSDMLAGQWFLKAANIPDNEVLPKEHVLSSLRKIYSSNVLPFENGTFGAVNGMKKNGKMDYSCVQSDEFWVGTTYGLAATMIQEGMVEEGFKTAEGAYRVCYELYGLQFQTPEAYKLGRKFRSLAYMRPLTVWAIQYALEKFHPEMLKATEKAENGHAAYAAVHK